MDDTIEYKEIFSSIAVNLEAVKIGSIKIKKESVINYINSKGVILNDRKCKEDF